MNYIKLFNVEFDDKYDDVIVFSSKSEQSSYFSSRFIEEFGENDITVVKELSTVRIYGNYNELQSVNYAYFENEIEGITRGYYAFVTSVSWAGIGVVSLSLSIDVFQTYMFEHKLAPSYVRRANVHQFTNESLPKPTYDYLQTPENVEYGDEYFTSKIADVNNNFNLSGDVDALEKYNLKISWVVFVCTESLKDNANHSVIDISNGGSLGYYDGLYYYLTPVIFGVGGRSTPVTDFYLLKPDGTRYNTSTYSLFLANYLFQKFSASTQVIGIYVLDGLKFPLDINIEELSNTVKLTVTMTIYPEKWIPAPYDKAQNNPNYLFFVPEQNIDDMIFEKSIDILDHFNSYYESDIDIKALGFPYCYYSITQDRGNEVIIKPQYLRTYQNDTGNKNILKLKCKVTTSVGAYVKQGVYVSEYLGNTPELRQVVNTAIGQLPQTTDAYLNFLQTQKASFDTGMNQIYERGAMNLLSSAAQGAAQGAAGGPWGAVAGAVAGAAQSARQTAMQVEMQQARIQDIKNTPDSMKKPGVDIKFEYITAYKGICITKYNISEAYQKRVSNYFKLYGYTINDFITDFDTFLDTREVFNYIQTTSSRVEGKINVQHIQALEQIYDHGVRLWHYNAATWTGFDFTKKNGDYYGTSRTPKAI